MLADLTADHVKQPIGLQRQKPKSRRLKQASD